MNKKKMWGRWAKFFFFPLFLLNFNFNNANDPPRAGSIQTAFRNYYLRRQKTYIPTIVRAAVTVQRQCPCGAENGSRDAIYLCNWCLPLASNCQPRLELELLAVTTATKLRSSGSSVGHLHGSQTAA